MAKSKSDETSLRPEFLVGLTCAVAVLIASLWCLKTWLTHTPATVEQAAIQPDAPPAADNLTRARQTGPRKQLPVARAFTPPVPPAAAPTTLEDGWGIQVSSMHLSMANSVVDLRYKILNPEKAARLGDGKTAAYIIDHATGKKLIMPTPPKEGAFPPTAHKLVTGKMYFAMVSNQGGALKSGSQVTVVVGGSEATNLTVE